MIIGIPTNGSCFGCPSQHELQTYLRGFILRFFETAQHCAIESTPGLAESLYLNGFISYPFETMVWQPSGSVSNGDEGGLRCGVVRPSMQQNPLLAKAELGKVGSWCTGSMCSGARPPMVASASRQWSAYQVKVAHSFSATRLPHRNGQTCFLPLGHISLRTFMPDRCACAKPTRIPASLHCTCVPRSFMS
eukprot:scaffold159890_cov14-Tisochrysis_lutea.AAC.3